MSDKIGGAIRIKFRDGDIESVTPVAPDDTYIAELEREVRRWKWDAEEEKRQRVQTVEILSRAARDNEAALNRVRALVMRHRKTLRMEDLIRALGWE